MKVEVDVPQELLLLAEAMGFDYVSELARAVKECFGDGLHGLEYTRSDIESLIDVRVEK